MEMKVFHHSILALRLKKIPSGRCAIFSPAVG